MTIALNCFVFEKIAFHVGIHIFSDGRQKTAGQHHRIKRFDSINLITGSYQVKNGWIRLHVIDINTQKNRNRIVDNIIIMFTWSTGIPDRSAAVRVERRRPAGLLTMEVRPRDAASSWAALAEDESAAQLQTGSSRLPLPQRPGSVHGRLYNSYYTDVHAPSYRQRPPVCGRPRRPAVSSLGINEHTRRACDAPVNSRWPRVSGGRGSRVEQSAGRCHFVAIAVDIQETAELAPNKQFCLLKTELFVRSYP